MKHLSLLLSALAFVTATISSCSDDETIVKKQIIPLRLEQDGYELEFAHDAKGRVSKVLAQSFMPNDVVIKTNYEYFYTTDGKFEKCIVDNGYKLVYTYSGDKIIRTDEFINDQFTQYHAFTYTDAGFLKEIVSWQNIPEEGGWIPHSKGVYVYDANGNLTNQLAYYYNSGSKEHKLLTSFEYSNYDNKKESQAIFSNATFNPLVKMRKNNPGKLVVKNMNGVVSVIDEYTYSYNDEGYVTSKVTQSTFVQSGNTGSYTTRYFYAER